MSGAAVRIGLGIALVILLGGSAAARVAAHAEYERSVPSAGARVPRIPERVEIWFTQELFRRGGANTIEVYAGDGSRIDDNAPIVDTDERRRLSVGVARAAEPGAYRVEWRSLSALDGDTASGSFTFTIDPAAPEPPTRTAPPKESGSDGAPSLTQGGQFAWWVLVAAPSLLASAVLFARAIGAPFDRARN